MTQQIDKINEENEQVIYDALFMSEPEFVMVYGELYRTYTGDELKDIFKRVRDKVTTEKIPYNRKLKKSRLHPESLRDTRNTQEPIKVNAPAESEKGSKKDDKETSKKERKTPEGSSLKEEILKLHEQGLSKAEIRTQLGCKYQYVFQTVKKHEDAKKVDTKE